MKDITHLGVVPLPGATNRVPRRTLRPTPTRRPSTITSSAADDGQELYRLCVFEFFLACGHLVTVALTGWYPVVVSCCDRPGGTILRGDYEPYASDID
jgi:hypothetical protein